MDHATDPYTPIRKGLLEFALLRIISAQQVYAADILKKLNETTFATQEGTLYPLLSKMRREGFLEYEWIESESGPPRKYYKLTGEGKQRLKEIERYWQEISKTLQALGK